MRIDAYNRISQVYQTSNTKPVTKQNKTSKTDKIEISDFGQGLALAKQAVSEAPEVREEKVAELKAQISSGNYNISSEEIADKMIGQYFSASI
jgi:negative regulator of flagellin synthesis FlgM